MFVLYANKNQLTVRQREPVTSGSVNAYEVRFEFSEDWDGLTRTAVFKGGGETRSILLGEDGRCVIPWEVLQAPMTPLEAGVRGARGGEIVLPTGWACLGMILRGAAVGEDAGPPTPDLWRQALDQKQDALRGLPGQVVGFDANGSAVPVDMPSAGEGGAVCEFGHGLKRTGNVVSVDAVDDFSGDNTLPMTAAGVWSVVGTIDALLSKI